MNSNQTEDKNHFRRKFPRREMRRRVGILCGGQYFLAESGEIGEGGMAFLSEFVLNDEDQVVISFQIPNGDFVSVKAVVRTTQKKDSESFVTHGVSFENIQFKHKRQIRSFVSDRGASGMLN